MKEKKWEKIEYDMHMTIRNVGGSELGYSKTSNINLIEQDGYLFKDLNGNGVLDPYEDWRLPLDKRAYDLAKRLPTRYIAGLMLYSSHQTVLFKSSKYEKLFGKNTYNGLPLSQCNASIWDLTDQQKEFLANDNLRHVLLSSVENTEATARWSNNMQSYVESLEFGIPINISSDPRHGMKADAEYNLGAGSGISRWPEQIGLAATFDTEVVKEFGEILAKEYRSLGIGTALSPQIDIATDPRWRRFSGTFGEDADLAVDLGKAYIDGAQTSNKTSEVEKGWGYESVNAMVKHWPGGGSGEGGRDAHFTYGKYAVYPGNNFNEHLRPFTEGAFRLNGKTSSASAIMPYYTVPYDQDKINGENVGNAFNRYIITDLLRTKYKFEGVVCTDWMITADHGPKVSTFSGKCWGLETTSVEERHFRALEAGVDQFGGNNDIKPVLKAFEMYEKKYGKSKLRYRIEQSAVRILMNMFRLGLFDNPYLDVEKSVQTVGSITFVERGYEAQKKSVVLLKNKNNVLPINKNKKVYIPKRRVNQGTDWFGNNTTEKYEYPVDIKLVEEFYHVTEDPSQADFALIFIESPQSDGYNGENDGNGYVPISLQFKPYQAISARSVSIAGGDPLESSPNRSYKNKWNNVKNENDLYTVLETHKLMKEKPVIVSLLQKKPTIVSEFEEKVEGLITHFGVQTQVLLELISGMYRPSGLLPFQMPLNMETVEEQQEDVAHDMKCYKDSEGNKYDFAFGLDWDGVITDERVLKYSKKAPFPNRPTGGKLEGVYSIKSVIDQDSNKTGYTIDTGIGEEG